MSALDSMTSTALTDLPTRSNSAALTFSGMQTGGLQDPLNFNPRTSSSLTVTTDLAFDSISDTRWLGADTLQPVTNFFNFNQPIRSYQDDLTGLATGTFNQPTAQRLDFATGDAIVQTASAQANQPTIQHGSVETTYTLNPSTPSSFFNSFSIYDASGDTTYNTVFEGGSLRFNYSLNCGVSASSIGLEAINSSGIVFNLGSWSGSSVSNAVVNLSNHPGLSGGSYQLRTVTSFSGIQLFSNATNLLQVQAWGQTDGSFTGDTFNYSADLRTGAVFLGRGGTDTLNLEISRSQVAKINGLSLNDFNPLTNSTAYQATFKGTSFDFLTLTNGREIYFQGIENLRFSDSSNFQLQVRPTDPFYSQQWNLSVSDVSDAWRFTQGSSNVLLASLDTGVLSVGRIDMPLNRLITNAATDDTSDSGHGHQSVSVMSSTGNNGSGIAGINWNSNIDVQDVYGGVNLQQAIQQVVGYARANNLRVVFQGGIQGESWLNSGGTQAQLESLISANSDIAVFAVAAGNGYRSINDTTVRQQDVNYYLSLGRSDLPLSGVFSAGVARLQNTHSNVMAVGALEHTATTVNGLANASAVNLAAYSNYGTGVIMAATDSYAMTQSGVANSGFNGTSCATPNMAGIASLVWSANINLTGSQVRQIIFDTAMDLGEPGGDVEFGRGLVNADAAVRRATALSRNLDVAALYSGSSILA